MNNTLEILCTSKGNGWHDRMFICRTNLERIFEGDWDNRDFVACLKKATPKSRRPRKDALKLKIPLNWVSKGVIVEQPDGRFNQDVLTAEADGFIRSYDLAPQSYWVWVEYAE